MRRGWGLWVAVVALAVVTMLPFAETMRLLGAARGALVAGAVAVAGFAFGTWLGRAIRRRAQRAWRRSLPGGPGGTRR